MLYTVMNEPRHHVKLELPDPSEVQLRYELPHTVSAAGRKSPTRGGPCG